MELNSEEAVVNIENSLSDDEKNGDAAKHVKPEESEGTKEEPRHRAYFLRHHSSTSSRSHGMSTGHC
jgi:hypothetical protein